MSNDFLSQEEVDALLSNVSGEKQELKEEVTPSAEPQPYDLTKQERIVRGRMATLEIINDRTSRTLRQGIYSLLRKNPEITHAGVKPLKYSEWLKHLPVPASFNIIHVKGLRGNSLIILEPGFIFTLIDSLFGGTGQFHTRIEGRDFSQTEQQVINRTVLLLCETLTSAWRPIIPLEFSFVRSEIHAQFAAIATPSEVVLTSQFKVEIGDSSGHFWVCFPYASIEPLKEQLSNDLQNDTERDDSRWKQVLGTQLLGSDIGIICEIARKKIKLKDIVNLKEGSFIEIGDTISVKGYCSDELLFEGTPGENSGKYAVKITNANKTTKVKAKIKGILP